MPRVQPEGEQVMSKHTLAPWSLETVPTAVGHCHKVGPFPSLGARPETFACVYADGEPAGGAVHDELKANARLIAASPDLLEAAKGVFGQEGVLPEPVWKALEAAILKAEGGK